MPSVLYGEAEDPRHRRPRRPVREALRQVGQRQEIATSRRRPDPRAGAVPCAGQEGGEQMFEAIEDLLSEYSGLEQRLADPAVHADAAQARKLGRRYAELTQVVEAYRALRRTEDDLATARELAADDDDFKAELPAL